FRQYFSSSFYRSYWFFLQIKSRAFTTCSHFRHSSTTTQSTDLTTIFARHVRQLNYILFFNGLMYQLWSRTFSAFSAFSLLAIVCILSAPGYLMLPPDLWVVSCSLLRTYDGYGLGDEVMGVFGCCLYGLVVCTVWGGCSSFTFAALYQVSFIAFLYLSHI